MAKRKSGTDQGRAAGDAAPEIAANDVQSVDEAVPEPVIAGNEVTAELSGDERPALDEALPPGASDPSPAEGLPGEDGPDAEIIDLAEARALAPEVVDDIEPDGGDHAQGNLALGGEGGEGGEAGGDQDAPGTVAFEQLEPLIESLLFASDRPLSVADLKRLTGERDSRLLNQALEALTARRADGGVIVVSVGGGYCLRTNPAFAGWVGKLLAAKPVRLSRAMLETLAIIAYRQPITRPEMDEIRGVDCGPVLKTLLDRGLIRIIGKKEEVGRPMLYGTTPEFLRVFSLKDLTQLPTLRQFHELSAEHQAKVAAKHGQETGGAEPGSTDVAGVPDGPPAALAGDLTSPITRSSIAADPEEDDGLLSELEEASELAARAAAPLHVPAENPPGEGSPPTGASE